jgi:hypothetical protein
VKKESFEIKVGARVAYSGKTGKVTGVRGNGPQPYEVQVRWEGESHPEWFLFVTLTKLHAGGHFRVVEQGRGTWLARLCPSCFGW